MRKQIWIATCIVTRTASVDPDKTIVLLNNRLCESEDDANNWLETQADIHTDSKFYVSHETVVKKEIIETDDFEDYAPVYKVKLRVEYEKIITVVIDDATDEENAEEIAERRLIDGEYDDDLEYEDWTSRECYSIDVSEATESDL